MATTTALPSAAWPEGVIARYSTVGQSTVDIVQRISEPYTSPPSAGTRFSYPSYKAVDITYTVVCQGCQRDYVSEHAQVEAVVMTKHFVQQVDRPQGPQGWAQAHADQCRAMVRPTA